MLLNKMTIHLDLFSDSFRAEAHIECPCHTKKHLSFLLNRELEISSVTGNGALQFAAVEEKALPFRSPAKVVRITSGKPIRDVHIVYCGAVQFDRKKQKNWNNIITEDIASLSWYSVWYPQNLSVHVLKNRVFVHNAHEWVVLKANYDEGGDTWEYGGHGFDPYNIIAYRKSKLHLLSNQSLNLYTVEDKALQTAQNATAIYANILEYYNGGLFRRKKITPLDIACISPAIQGFGGYRRKGLMWCTALDDDPIKMEWLLAHETAHIWCSGAKADSWEDWLNETTAEWSVLLYAIRAKKQALFDAVYAPKAAAFSSLPPIRTPDKSRPSGVHEKGCVLFYRAYQASDFETMERVVRCFSELGVKTTQAFLLHLKLKGLTKIAYILEQGLSA